MSEFSCYIIHDQDLFAQINNMVNLSTTELFLTVHTLFLKTFKSYFSKPISFSISSDSSYCFPTLRAAQSIYCHSELGQPCAQNIHHTETKQQVLLRCILSFDNKIICMIAFSIYSILLRSMLITFLSSLHFWISGVEIEYYHHQCVARPFQFIREAA